MVEILVIVAIVWIASKSVKSGAKVVGDDYRREATARKTAAAKAHPDWSPRRRNRIAGARAFGATVADLLHLGPAVLRGMHQGWQEARAEWGGSREEHQEWRIRRHGELAERRAARGGKRPSLWRRIKDRVWRRFLGPVPQVAFVDPPAPADNVVPIPARTRPAPARSGPGSDEPGWADPAPADPDSAPAQPRPAPTRPRPAPAQPDPGSSKPAPAQEPADPAPAHSEPGSASTPDPTPTPAPAGTGTETAEPSAGTTSGGTAVAPTGETSTYEATNVALDSFSEAAAETLSAAEAISLPITEQAGAILGAAEQLSASFSSIGMKDEGLNSRARTINGTAADLKAAAEELDRQRLHVIELAMKLDADARDAKEHHEQGQGKVREALVATGGSAENANQYAGV